MTVEIGEDGDYEPDAVMHCGDPLPGDAGDASDTRILTAGEIRLDPPGIAIAIEQFYAG